MIKEKNNMDNFLRGSLGNLKVEPSQSVWKGISKRLIILELLRLNFTNVGKSWLYSGAAILATFSGIVFYNMTETIDSTPEINNIAEQSIANENLNENKPANQDLVTLENSELTRDDHTLNEEKAEKENSNFGEQPLQEKAGLVNIDKVENIATSHANTSQSSMSRQTKFAEKTNRLVDLQYPKQINSKKISQSEGVVSMEKEEQISIANSLDINKSEKQLSANKYSDTNKDEIPTNPNSKALNYFLCASYMPEWPISSEEMYVNNHQFSLQGGIQLNKLNISVEVGLKTEKTPTLFNTKYSSYDSVGYYYNIDSYEVDPINQDTIIIHYTIESLYDSVNHYSEIKGPDQTRRWIFIPLDLSYQIYATSKYQLLGKISLKLGWNYYTEKMNLVTPLSVQYSTDDLTPESKSPYFQMGLGFENDFKIMPQWWITAEPRINYYLKSPYEVNSSGKNGPFGFGIQLGVKYNIKGR